jgi:hypothetical protein
MSLLVVHKLLIAIAITFCAGLAAHSVASGDGDQGAMLRGAASATGAILLRFYLRWFMHSSARATTAAPLRHGRSRDNQLQ